MTPKQPAASTSASVMEQFGTAVLSRVGVPPEDARVVVQSLVEAELRGVTTHGLMRLRPYARMVVEGNMNPRPKITTISETSNSTLLDADNGIGNLICVRATEAAIEKARGRGLAMVGVRNSTHCGALAYYPMLALPHDCIGLMTSNGPPLVPPYGALTRILGTNPYAAAVPAGDALPVVIDMGITVAAAGKVRVRANLNQKLPPGWARERHGRPTEDAYEAMAHGFLNWMGDHKGSALAILANILSGVLTGGAYLASDYQHFDRAEYGSYRFVQGHSIIVIDIASFMVPSEFKARMDAMISEIKAAPAAPGFDGVYLPGELEYICRETRLARGIPLVGPVIEDLKWLSREYDIELDL